MNKLPFVLLLLLSCRQPPDQKIVGIYEVDKYGPSGKVPIEPRFRFLVLSGDGTFTFRNVDSGPQWTGQWKQSMLQNPFLERKTFVFQSGANSVKAEKGSSIFYFSQPRLFFDSALSSALYIRLDPQPALAQSNSDRR